MKPVLARRALMILSLGDTALILAVTLLGFTTHSQSLAGTRWLTTFLPLCAAWGLTAPWFGLYSSPTAQQPAQVWRVLWATVLAAPLAAVLRSLWLNTTVIPIFAAVLLGASALGLGLWRLVFSGWIAKRL